MREPALLPARLLGAIAALLGALVSLSRIGDYDVWYHLRAGDWILAHGIPATDPFAYTAASAPASVQSWLAAVLLALAHRAGGIPGVQLANALAVAIAFGFVFAAARERGRREDLWLAALLVGIAVFATRFRLGPRPHVLEYALLAADLWVLHRLRSRGSAPLWLLPVVQVAWVNVHGSHVLGVALPLLFLGGEALGWVLPAAFHAGAPALRPRRRAALLLAGAAAANAAATLANPRGVEALSFPFRVAGMGAYMARIGEWQPMTWDLLAGYGVRYTWAFSTLALLGLAGFALRRRAASPVDALLFVVFLVLAARGVRLAAEFAIATVPGTFANLAPFAARLAARRERSAALGAALALAVALPAAWLDRSYEPGFGAKERIFPGAALRFVRSAGVQGNVFNSFGFGDWLVFHAPERQVFIHGRNEVFPEAFYEDYLAAHRDPDAFRRLADRWDLQWTLLEYTLTDYGDREAMPALLRDPDWVPIYWDRVAVVYVRRAGPNAAIAARLGLPLLRPTRFDFGYLDELVRAGHGPAALADVNALLARAPDNEEAHLAAAAITQAMGRPDVARRALEAALAINPRRSMTRSALGLVALGAGDAAAARAHFEAALAIEPGDPGAIWGMQRLGVKIEAPPDARPAGHP